MLTSIIQPGLRATKRASGLGASLGAGLAAGLAILRWRPISTCPRWPARGCRWRW